MQNALAKSYGFGVTRVATLASLSRHPEPACHNRSLAVLPLEGECKLRWKVPFRTLARFDALGHRITLGGPCINGVHNARRN